jgi:hypothetical protein
LLNRASCRALLVGAVALFPAAAASAQDPPCARPAFARLSALEGTWRVSWTNRVSPTQFEHTTARSQIAAVIPHCALLERFTATVQGSPFWATALLTAPAPDTAHRVWLDSSHGEPVLFEGRWLADTLAFEWARDLGDRRVRLRHLYFAIAPDFFRTVTYLSPSAAAGWQVVAEAAYRRERSP